MKRRDLKRKSWKLSNVTNPRYKSQFKPTDILHSHVLWSWNRNQSNAWKLSKPNDVCQWPVTSHLPNKNLWPPLLKGAKSFNTTLFSFAVHLAESFHGFSIGHSIVSRILSKVWYFFPGYGCKDASHEVFLSPQPDMSNYPWVSNTCLELQVSCVDRHTYCITQRWILHVGSRTHLTCCKTDT